MARQRNNRSVTKSKSFRPLLEPLEDRLTPAVDLGPSLVAAPDAGLAPTVRVYDAITLKERFSFLAFDANFFGGVAVSTADVNRDGVADIIAGTAQGGNVVKVFSGVDGTLLRSFLPFGPLYTAGIYVAGGDVNGDGFGDIITGTAEGGGNRVKVFSGRDLTLLHNFIAFDPLFTGGVRVGAGDINGDGRADILTCPGAEAGTQLKVFSGRDLTLLQSFVAYDPSVTSMYVRAGDVDGDRRLEIITGAGSGPGQVNVFRALDHQLIFSFIAFDPLFTGGVRIAAADINGDGKAEVIAAPGPNHVCRTTIYDPLTQGAIADFIAFDPDFTGGMFIGAGVSKGTPPNGRPAGTLPFKLSGDGQFQLDPQTLTGTLSASGQATHLGHWTSTGDIQLTAASATTFGITGTVTFTAANGDKLYASVCGALDLATGKAATTYTFTGGTGRFTGAQGSAEEAAIIVDFAAGTYTFTLDGYLDLPTEGKKR